MFSIPHSNTAINPSLVSAFQWHSTISSISKYSQYLMSQQTVQFLKKRNELQQTSACMADDTWWCLGSHQPHSPHQQHLLLVQEVALQRAMTAVMGRLVLYLIPLCRWTFPFSRLTRNKTDRTAWDILYSISTPYTVVAKEWSNALLCEWSNKENRVNHRCSHNIQVIQMHKWKVWREAQETAV